MINPVHDIIYSSTEFLSLHTQSYLTLQAGLDLASFLSTRFLRQLSLLVHSINFDPLTLPPEGVTKFGGGVARFGGGGEADYG